MNKPLHFSSTGPLPTTSSMEARVDFRCARTADCPTPEAVGFEIGVILAVTLAIACVVPLALSVCGVE